MTNSDQIISLMKSAAKSSGKIIKDNFRGDLSASEKSSHLDIVTKTDLLSQNNIHKVLSEGMESLGFQADEIGFIEEEEGQSSLKKYNFIVDPLDGTTNFASGIPYSCISISYAIEKEIAIGLVYDPYTNTFYWGEKGERSFVEDSSRGVKKLFTKPKNIKLWIVSTHINGLDKVDEQFAIYRRVYPHVRGLRNMGSLTLDLCYLADNIIDIVFNFGCYIWDIAAAQLILKESGSEIFDNRGDQLMLDWENTHKKYQIIACNPDNKLELLSLISNNNKPL